MSPIAGRLLPILLAVAALLPGAAPGFPLLVPTPVVEYYSTGLDHYFLTASPAEMDDIAAGKAGPGWVRTGYSFLADPLDGCILPCGKPVSRFYSTGSKSHFYTADAGEAAAVGAPGTGWVFERIEFSIPLPSASGQCASGEAPVYRLFNNRWMVNDGNHRYVTSETERARMRARGWIDEGVRFCSRGAVDVPIRSLTVSVARQEKLQPSSVCEDEAQNLGACIAFNNLPVPATSVSTSSDDFFNRTGMHANPSIAFDPEPSIGAQDTFVQPIGNTLGIHVDTRRRGAAILSSVNPLYQMRTSVAPGTFDTRFFPFGAYESEVELCVSFLLNVKMLNVRGMGGAAYGHPTLEFIDQRSGRHLYFTVLAYGTVAPGDYLAPDSTTGKVIVGTTFGPHASYGRSLGLDMLPTPSGFVSPNFWGWGGAFEFRMSRAEFQQVLDAARTVDAALSAAPADYLLDNFHFNNEVSGDGEIGVNLGEFTLRLLRR